MDLRGMADLLAIGSMFFLLLTASSLLYLTSSLLGPSPRRLEELRVEHLYRALELSEPLPGLGYLRAVGEHLLLEDPTVPENEIRSSLQRVLGFFCPENRGVMVELRRENAVWREGRGEGKELARRRGALALSTPGGLVIVEVEVKLLG